MPSFMQHKGWTPGLCVHQTNTVSMGWHLLACKFINQMSMHWCVIRKATTNAGWVKPHKTSEQTLCRHWTLRTLNIWRWPHVTFLEYKVPAGRANRNSFGGIKNLRISFMLVTKIIPVDVPKKMMGPSLSLSHAARGSCAPQAVCTSLSFTPASQASLPLPLLVSPCRISSSAFTQTRKSSAHYSGRGMRQKTMEQASTTLVRKTSWEFLVCKATVSVLCMAKPEYQTQKLWGLGPFRYHTEFTLKQAPVSLKLKHFKHVLTVMPLCWWISWASIRNEKIEAVVVWKTRLKTSAFF